MQLTSAFINEFSNAPNPHGNQRLLRVCHVIETGGGGSGQVVIDLASEQLIRGYDVTLIFSPSRAERKFLNNIYGIPGVCLVQIPFQRKVGGKDLLDAYRLYKVLKKNGPFDIIHSHSSKAGALTRVLSPLLPRSSQVYTPHAFVTMSPDARRAYGWIEFGLSFFAQSIIVSSEQERQHGIALGISEQRLRLIPNGVDIGAPGKKSAVRETLGLRLEDFVVGFVGRLTEQKNPLRAISAFCLAAPVRSNAHLAIVGDGPLLDQAKQRARESHFADRIHFLGGQNATDVMPAFDCLLCSSNYESFALIFIEALAFGLPIISTNVGPIPELHAKCNSIFVAHDFQPECLAKHLTYLFKTPFGQREAYACRARELSDSYSVRKMFDNTHALYESLLSNKVSENASRF